LPVLNPARLVRRLGAQAYHPFYKLIRARTITRLRQQGIDVFVWTVNDAKRMRALVQANASGIITDFPQVLAPILDACA
jgi:glycerophosphoryl diester phosphodiesterase